VHQILRSFLTDLAREDHTGRPPPKAPKVILKRLGVTAQSVAIEWLRRQSIYLDTRQLLAAAEGDR
jgi:hypothetical protein